MAVSAVFILSLTLRWTFLYFWGGLLLPDSTGRYLPTSENLFDHWSGTVYDTPGYPALLAVVSRCLGPGVAVLYLQGILDSLSVAMIFDIGHRLLPPRSALAIGLFFAFHFGAIVFTVAVLSETLFTFLLISAVWFYVWSKNVSRWFIWFLPGLALGLASITRANGIATIFAFGLCLCLPRKPPLRWPHLVAFVLAAALPILAWVQFNSRNNGVRGIAQGGGWQWLQNLAYFDMVRPQTLPPPHDRTYRDWTSLSDLRRDLMARNQDHPNRVDPALGAIARENALAQPWPYIANLPRAWLLPRRFIKDTTAKFLAKAPSSDPAGSKKYQSWLGLRRPPAVLKAFYTLARILTIIPYKYSLLIATLPALLWIAWRRRDRSLLMLTLLPASQALPLLLFLNPIERYYFPFEPLMIMALFRGFLLWRGSIAPVPTIAKPTQRVTS